MKTRTIYNAYEQASYEVRQRMQSYPERHSQKYFILLRQKTTFEAALLRRIEQGDRAREALRRLQDDMESYGASREFCEAARLELSAYWAADKR